MSEEEFENFQEEKDDWLEDEDYSDGIFLSDIFFL